MVGLIIIVGMNIFVIRENLDIIKNYKDYI
jgi:hypothetical protein